MARILLLLFSARTPLAKGWDLHTHALQVERFQILASPRRPAVREWHSPERGSKRFPDFAGRGFLNTQVASLCLELQAEHAFAALGF
jgi:hypothetical protein